MHDPALTPYGEDQCRDLQLNFPAMHSVDLVVSSPMKRTLHTALIAFEPALKEKGLKVIALPELQETSDLPCDTGSPVEEIQREFAEQSVDLRLVKPGWDNKRVKWAPTVNAVEKRAKDVRAWLMQRQESEIVLVTHGGFLQYLTSNWSASAASRDTRSHGWGNAEWRTFTFSSADLGSAVLVETVESRQRRVRKQTVTEGH